MGWTMREGRWDREQWHEEETKRGWGEFHSKPGERKKRDIIEWHACNGRYSVANVAYMFPLSSLLHKNFSHSHTQKKMSKRQKNVFG